jgi:hypothetical protein
LEKISYSDVDLEKGFEKIKFRENIKLISVWMKSSCVLPNLFF